VACKTGAIAAARRQSNLPIWVSYTLRDEAGREGPTELRSGESVEQAVAGVIAHSGNSAVRIGVYANAFLPEPDTVEPYAGISGLRNDLSPERYLECATQWVRAGATIVGGCCGIGPGHIAALRGTSLERANQCGQPYPNSSC
jgi:S-methylmethionine-dependent homocysteine/selenocysteine methylase